MKIKLFLIAALAGVALVGCNRENGLENNKVEASRFMGVHISMVTATKAADTVDGGYEYGSDDENDFNSVYFYFYKDGIYVSYGKGESEAEFEATAGTEASVEELWKASDGRGVVVIESDLQTTPNQMLCVVNCTNPLYFRNKSLDDALAALMANNDTEGIKGVNNSADNRELSFVKLNGDGSKVYFTMFNSPEIVDGKEQYVVKITEDDIFTEEEGGAEKAKDYPVEVWIERVATKATLDDSGYTVNASLENDWAFTIDAWGLNGVSQNAFAIHKINKDWVGAAFNTPAFVVGPHRINWAIDPDYESEYSFLNEDFYPHSARDYGLQEGGDPAATTSRQALARLKYWSMNEIEAHDGATLPAYNKLRQTYALENTFGKTGQMDARYVGTHAIVIATLQKKVDGVTQPVQDLYYYMGAMFTKADYQEAVVARVQTEYKIYTDAAGTTQLAVTDMEDKPACKPDDFSTNGNFFELVEAGTGDKGYHDGMITFYPKSGVKLYKENDTTPGTYDEMTADEIKKAFLHDVIDLANKYKDGKMWYCIPIEHLGKAKDSSDNLLEGNYGMVRNHWYKITVTEIANFGHGISDPDEPIVPGEKTEKWYMAAKINVNAWHIVKQNAVLAE